MVIVRPSEKGGGGVVLATGLPMRLEEKGEWGRGREEEEEEKWEKEIT